SLQTSGAIGVEDAIPCSRLGRDAGERRVVETRAARESLRRAAREAIHCRSESHAGASGGGECGIRPVTAGNGEGPARTWLGILRFHRRRFAFHVLVA